MVDRSLTWLGSGVGFGLEFRVSVGVRVKVGVEDARGREVAHRLAEGAPARHAEGGLGTDVSVRVGIGGGGIPRRGLSHHGGGAARTTEGAEEARLRCAVRTVHAWLGSGLGLGLA